MQPSDWSLLRLSTTPGSGHAGGGFRSDCRLKPRGQRNRSVPEVELPDRDEEERSLDLLYRNRRSYAIGHGCAAEWGAVTSPARSHTLRGGAPCP